MSFDEDSQYDLLRSDGWSDTEIAGKDWRDPDDGGYLGPKAEVSFREEFITGTAPLIVVDDPLREFDRDQVDRWSRWLSHPETKMEP